MTYQSASYDILSVVISVALSFLGCFAALVSAIRIPLSSGRRRRQWISAASVSLGGGAIWSMHFVAMTAYHLGDMEIVYNVPLTALSLVVAVAASALGISIVATDPRSLGRIAVGGVTAGLGIALMHYTGMAAMRTGSRVTYDPGRVVLSVGIAVGAALAALVIAFRVRSRTHVLLASTVMTVAVCGMHYTAMTAVRVERMDVTAPMTGADPIAMVLAVCVVTFTVLAGVIILAIGALSEEGSFRLERNSGRTGQVATDVVRGAPNVFSPRPVPRNADFDPTPVRPGHRRPTNM
ncbi:histidine kinase [Frankia sp. AgB1.9]|uniref:MHYT domain-containing protein n=1 Tax=unclassified Frankia TaxID=2632575 RepID=UPI0019315164|nr:MULTISPECIES: MHYT domain-containing protein [unclassified Frankia]MBL7487004.1 histidine kinase [Frankia sp. AgW1.1]MBL7552030.1 histidine kinase [Frankia sp. AgB1.9]MBL7623349.1 histidine kinase [Frankia sp. AgB1.8]